MKVSRAENDEVCSSVTCGVFFGARHGRAAPNALNDSARAKRDEVRSSVTGARARGREARQGERSATRSAAR